MNPKLKDALKILAFPLMILGIYLSMRIIWKIFELPTDTELLPIVKTWFSTYGLWIVFAGAIVEGFLLLGQYFPGGVIIFLGVISAGKNVGQAVAVVFVVCAAFFISYTLNYLLGKYGWYKLLAKFGLSTAIEKSKEKLTNKGLNAIFFSYWDPNLASIAATAAGILQIPLVKFSLFSAAGIVLWNIFWGALVYNLGESALKMFVGLKYVLIVFAVWIGVLIIKKYWFGRVKI